MAAHRYRIGDRGHAVAEIRGKLAQLGLLPGRHAESAREAADQAVFDTSTDHAVRHFQQQRGLTADGVVDTATYRTLDEARWRLGDRLLSYVANRPITGDDVAALQRRILELGFDVGRVDGVYGERTEQAVRELQRNVGVPADGTCGPATFKALARLAPIVKGGRADALRDSEQVHRAGPRLHGKVVVIDPGHGDPDLGNQANDLNEAEVAFDLASRIEGRLAATGVRALLTRGGGGALSELDRARFANDTGADLVVSLHVDAAANPEACGVSTYFYGSELHGVRSALGERFAGLVQREIVARTDLLDCRTHAKTWGLLRHTQMAAIRIEIGYLTNEGDSARLADPGFRDVVAESVVVAVQRVYLPPDLDSPTGLLQMSELLS